MIGKMSATFSSWTKFSNTKNVVSGSLHWIDTDETATRSQFRTFPLVCSITLSRYRRNLVNFRFEITRLLYLWIGANKDRFFETERSILTPFREKGNFLPDPHRQSLFNEFISFNSFHLFDNLHSIFRGEVCTNRLSPWVFRTIINAANVMPNVGTFYFQFVRVS